MNVKAVRLTSVVLIVIMMLGIMSGCKKEETYDNYSYGLTEAGFYENLDKYPCELPDFKSWRFTCDEVLEWGVEHAKSSGSANVETVDEYVYLYGKEFLASIDLTNKEIAENGDIVSATLEFYINGEQLEDYTSTNNYEVARDGDSIVSSFVGHKAKDQYEVQYTFPEDDPDHPSETATVKVTINSVAIFDPIASGVVEDNLSVIGEYLDNVTDRESFLKALRPKLAEQTLEMFVEDRLQSLDGIVPPDEYTNYEMYRLKCRLQQLGYTYDNYLKDVKMTDDEVRECCELVARENYITMLIFKNLGQSVTENDLKEYHGDNLEYVISVQGEPYVRLNMMRDLAIYMVSDLVTLDGVDNDDASSDKGDKNISDKTNGEESGDSENNDEPTDESNSEHIEESVHIK